MYIYIYLVLFFCLLLRRLALRSVCRLIFFYKFICTEPGLQLGDPAPPIGLLLWTADILFMQKLLMQGYSCN